MDASGDSNGSDAAQEALADVTTVDRDGPSACDDSPGIGFPQGWIPYAGYCRSCGLAVPATPADLPTPIAWEPCPVVSTVPTGSVCKQMKYDWASAAPSFPHIGGAVLGSNEPSGLTLLYTRVSKPAITAVVARADGSVLQAMQLNPKTGCYFDPGFSLRNGNFMFTMTRYESEAAQVVLGGGAVGGALLDPPKAHLQSAASLAIATGTSLYLDVGAANIHQYSDDKLLATLSVPTFTTAHHSFFGDVLLYDEFNATTNAVGFRTTNGALHDVSNFGSDVTQGAADLVTDGNDFVWLEAFGRATKNDPWTGARLMTAKYTTNTATLAPRRVRSWSWERFAATSFVVGCGYVVGNIVDNNNLGIIGVRVVRLSDGVSWKLVGPNNTQELRWSTPVAVTCDEAFVRIDVGNEWNVGRIRIDSLGAGALPD